MYFFFAIHGGVLLCAPPPPVLIVMAKSATSPRVAFPIMLELVPDPLSMSTSLFGTSLLVSAWVSVPPTPPNVSALPPFVEAAVIRLAAPSTLIVVRPRLSGLLNVVEPSPTPYVTPMRAKSPE